MKKEIGIVIAIIILIMVVYGIFVGIGDSNNGESKSTNESTFKGYQVKVSGASWHVNIASNKSFGTDGSGTEIFDIGPANFVHVTARKDTPSHLQNSAPLHVSILKDGKVVNSTSGYNKYATAMLSYYDT